MLDYLIRCKATGNQQQFARKAGMSRAMLNIYLNEMKMLGFPINFSRARNTYYYEEDGSMVNSLFERRLSKEEMKQYGGGNNHADIVNMFHWLNGY